MYLIKPLIFRYQKKENIIKEIRETVEQKKLTYFKK